MQGSPFQPNLGGGSAAAERSYRKSLVLAERLVRQKPDDIEAHLQLDSSQFSLGRLLVVSGGLPEARKLNEDGRDRAEKLAIEYGYDPRVTEMRSRGAMFLEDAFALGFESEKARAS